MKNAQILCDNMQEMHTHLHLHAGAAEIIFLTASNGKGNVTGTIKHTIPCHACLTEIQSRKSAGRNQKAENGI